MSIEKKFDISFISALALREKQVQQNYRPIIAVHKWFARRPGTLFRGLILSEFGDRNLREAFFSTNNFKRIKIADPFMGGGTPLIEANRVGCDVIGYDINPMAYWIVNREIEHLDLRGYRRAAGKLVRDLEKKIGCYYQTQCLECGSTEARVKYFLWVKSQKCVHCGEEYDLFPGYIMAENRRHPENIVVCSGCGALNGVKELSALDKCGNCRRQLILEGPARRNKRTCPRCGRINAYPNAALGAPRHRMFAIEYYCPICKPSHEGRFFKKPGEQDLRNYEDACSKLKKIGALNIPDDEIQPGDETNRLLRWGYKKFREMFNGRQLLGLELSCRAVAECSDERIKDALITNISDLLRYQNMLCRYDSMALKSLDIFSIHGFPVGLIQCESNFLGIPNGNGMSVGSGGWSNILEKYIKAKEYCDQPFEIRYEGKKKVQAPIIGEWIGDRKKECPDEKEREVHLFCGSASDADIQEHTLDAVLTDPPYYGNVQYAELMDFCYVWLRKLVGRADPAFRSASTRNPEELTGNMTMDRGFAHFTEGLSVAFQKMAKALKPGSPLAFTYHHNKLEAYQPLIVAILDSGLACSASMPCPAEMSGSIHINKTGSSIVDTVFVCRSTGVVPRRWIVDSPDEVTALVLDDLDKLQQGGLKPTLGDIRCILYGHISRLLVWRLRSNWRKNLPIQEKLDFVSAEIKRGIEPEQILDRIAKLGFPVLRTIEYVRESKEDWCEGRCDEIPF